MLFLTTIVRQTPDSTQPLQIILNSYIVVAPFPMKIRKPRSPEQQPPDTLELETMLSKETSRRDFLRRAGKAGITLASIGAGDTLWGEYLWGGTNPEVHMLDTPKLKERFPHTATLAIGGFGVADTQRLARYIRPGLADFGQVGYLKNSNSGIHMGDIIDETRRFIHENSIETLRLYGHSMGGMLAVALASNLLKDVRLDAIILDCSPASYKDVRSADQAGTLFLDIMDKTSLHMGPLTRLGIETLRPILNGRDDYLDICQHALTKISDDSCSNKLIQAQASFIRAFDVEDYKNIFPQSMPILRLRPDNYNADGTVNNETSLPRWRDGLNHTVTDITVAGSGHANPGKYPESYTIALHQAATEYNLGPYKIQAPDTPTIT